MKIEEFDAGTPVVTALASALDNNLVTDGQDVARFVAAVCQVEHDELRKILVRLADYWINNHGDSIDTDYICESLCEWDNV